MSEKIYISELGKPELNEDTLAHYGVKGMKWRKRKGRTKRSLNSNRRRSKQSLNQFESTVARAEQLAKARTNEERQSLAKSLNNGKTVNQKDIEKYRSQFNQKGADELREEIRKKKKKK